MRRMLTRAAALLAVGTPAAGAPSLLIIGSPHLGSAGSHTIKSSVAPVLTPQRQAEIEQLVRSLAAYRPTVVAVEWPAEQQAKLDRRYADYRAGRYTLSADEVDQIALRLAAQLGLPRVHAVDWNADPPGGWEHYNYETYVKAHGATPEWTQWLQDRQAEADQAAALMRCTPVSSWLRRVNSRAYRQDDHRAYFQVAQLGDRLGANPGAAWVGNWYTRNLRILNNIRAAAASPADRVLVVYGAGHGYLLNQLARESGVFNVADSLAFLPRSSADRLTACPSGRTERG